MLVARGTLTGGGGGVSGGPPPESFWITTIHLVHFGDILEGSARWADNKVILNHA